MYSIINFYHFFDLKNPEETKEALLLKGKELGINGTILLAPEGINVAVLSTKENMAAYVKYIQELLPETLEALVKESFSKERIFRRFKVMCKKEIVALGAPEVLPHKKMGTLVEPQDWNDLLKEENIIVIDTRNDYEIRVGAFQGSTAPHTRHFRNFGEYIKKNKEELKNKKVAMYCTGGIRCEKASAYLLQEEGFENVYQLKGGILNYLEKIPEEKSLWEGDLFLFDDRCAVNHQLEPQNYFFCRSCGDICKTDKGIPHGVRPGFKCEACQKPFLKN